MLSSRFPAIAMTTVGCLTVLVTTLFSSASQTSQILIGIANLLPVVGLVAALRRGNNSAAPSAATSNRTVVLSQEDERSEFEAWRVQVSRGMQEEARRIERSYRELNDRLVQFREFMEYPQPATKSDAGVTPTQLSEKDRKVNELLEQEAGRVYEKLRADGYKTGGKLDLVSIRNEVFDIIRRVARVYSPDSSNPILETSFDQLARAASRVCLQALVLAEQLPVDVQHYTLAQLYNYVRKGVHAWGTWQSVSPWLTRMSRGMYAGRLVAGASPVTMGAWWLASELGRHGTNKLVNRYVDQRAVAFFNDTVRLVGNEVACVYGPGIRQRDPAWALGAELAELNYRFPQSRESLQAGLRQMTALPLRSEYDRIYLYRCIAEHKPSGFRLQDSTVLTRDERDAIAKQLENFFRDYIHGATDDDVKDWRESFETLFDLKLQLDGSRPAKSSAAAQIGAIHSVHSFLTGAGGMSATEAAGIVTSGDLFLQQPKDDQAQLTGALAAAVPKGFVPPDLDPADEFTTTFLTELVDSVTRAQLYDSSIESLMIETGRYFRRGDEDMMRLIAAGWDRQLKARMNQDAPVSRRNALPAKWILQLLRPEDIVTAIYSEASVEPVLPPENSTLWLVVVEGTQGRQLMLFVTGNESDVLWTSAGGYSAQRVGGFITDDCALTGGAWQTPYHSSRIVVPGKFGSGFKTWFAPLLNEGEQNSHPDRRSATLDQTGDVKEDGR